MNSAVNKQKEGVDDGEVPTSPGLRSQTADGVVTFVSSTVAADVSVQSEVAHESAEQWPSSFELKDAEGKVVGVATAEYVDDLPKSGQDHFKRLVNLTITNPETGASVSLQDLISRDISQFSIQISGKEVSGNHSYLNGVIVLRIPLNDVKAFIFLLHELSHTEQELEDSLKEIKRLYGNFFAYNSKSYRVLTQVVDAIPSARGVLESDPAFTKFSEKLESLYAEPMRLTNQINVLTREKESLQKLNRAKLLYSGLKRSVGIDSSPSPKQRIADIDSELAILKKNYEDAVMQREGYLYENPINHHDLFALPFYYYEWDANNRAVDKVGVLRKKIGVDLASKIPCLGQAVLPMVGRNIPYPQTLEDVINIYRTPSRIRAKPSAESYAKPVLCAESPRQEPASEVQ